MLTLEQQNLLNLAKSKAFKVENESFVKIIPDRLTDDDIPMLEMLFTAIFQKKLQTALQLEIGKPNVNRLWPTGFATLSQTHFKPNNPFDSLAGIINNHSIIYHPPLFKALLASLQNNHIPIEVTKWAELIKNEIDNEMNAPDALNANVIYSFMQIIHCLYNITNQIEILELLLPKFILLVIIYDKLHLLPALIDQPVYIKVLQKTQGYPDYLLHIAIQYSKDFEILLNLLGGKPLYDYEQHGNSFLHLCKTPKLLDQALKLTPNIDHQNKLGNTSLHLAALHGDLEKVQYLLAHHANPDIQNSIGQTFWELAEGQSKLALYASYQKYGIALKIPPRILEQQGLNCAFYAIEAADFHHRIWAPQFFKRPHLLARSRDAHPKAENSLRKIRKLLGMVTTRGAIFTTEEMELLIKETECTSVVRDIVSYDHFIEVIKDALIKDSPVIIPFSVDGSGQPNLNYDSLGAHWAMVSALATWPKTKIDKILLAQYGDYTDTEAEALYKAFFYIDLHYPGQTIAKKDDWEVVTPEQFAFLCDAKMVEVIPSTDLSHFRRKLIVINPPAAPSEDQTQQLKPIA